MSKLHDKLAQTWLNIQDSLFPWLSEELGDLTDKQQELVTTLEMIRIDEFILSSYGYPGRLMCQHFSGHKITKLFAEFRNLLVTNSH